MLTPNCPRGRLLIGLSGGADSVALLHLLLDAGAEVAAVHVNHGLRGAESDGDEAFVRNLCANLNVPLHVYRADPPENPGENWAREVRYGFFRRAMQETGADALVLAHHRDDQAETLLLHLMRGAGLTGLTGMAADTQRDGASCGRCWLSPGNPSGYTCRKRISPGGRMPPTVTPAICAMPSGRSCCP